MDEESKRIRKKLRDDFSHYASKCLKIRSKSGEIKPFVLNQAQTIIHNIAEQQRREKGRVRVIIVKGRQMGCSTLIEGRFYWKVTHGFGQYAFILTHEDNATNNLFKMAKRYHENCPPVVKPTTKASNSKELIFDGLDSGYMLGTAGNKGTGRSATIQLFHGSEVAMWPNAQEHATGVMQAIPNSPGTEIFLESTARGIGNYFHEQWQLAESKQSEFIPIFVPWFIQPEYQEPVPENFSASEEEAHLVHLYGLSYPQLVWRRTKIVELSTGGRDGTKFFMQEYPSNSTEAFQTTGEDCYINPILVMQARKCIVEPVGNLIIGVDPARFGDDRSSIIRRRGRLAYKLESYSKKDTMEIANIVHRIIIEESPYKVCIDIGGLGAGVYDRLKELGHVDVIVAVNGGATPLDQKKYYNKRAEMWGLMNDWLLDTPCQIPDNDSLHADLCGIRYKYDSQSRLMMEKKEEMKKRGLRSPDESDALALTFAIPNSAIKEAEKVKTNFVGKEILSAFNRMDNLKKAAYKS